MKKQALFGFLLLTFFGCKSLDEKVENTELENEANGEIAYFKANGNEPSWNLEIANDSIKLKSFASGQETFKINHIEPIRAADADVKMYRIDSQLGKLNIQIVKGNCENTMSGAVSPYFVTTEFKRKTDDKTTILTGCGKYITDHRLHDIWVLEQLNGKKMTNANFMKELPQMEINTTTNKFSGFAGCNQMNGSLIFEKDILRFSKIISTKMMCDEQNKEGEFLKTLQSTTTYVIKDNRLWLSNPSGAQVVFKKVD